MRGEAGHQGVDLRPRGDAARRVRRGVDDEEARPRRDEGERFGSRERKAVLLADRDGDGCRAGELDHRAIDGKARIRIEDLGARLAEHQDRHEHGDLAARNDDEVVGRDRNAGPLVDVGGYRLAQGQDAGRGRIAVMAVAQGLDRCLDDMGRGRKIGLPDAQIDDVTALAGKVRGTGEDGEGILLADTGKGVDGLQGHGASGVLLISARR